MLALPRGDAQDNDVVSLNHIREFSTIVIFPPQHQRKAASAVLSPAYKGSRHFYPPKSLTGILGGKNVGTPYTGSLLETARAHR